MVATCTRTSGRRRDRVLDILRVELTGFPDGLNVTCDREMASRITGIFGQNNKKDETVIS